MISQAKQEMQKSVTDLVDSLSDEQVEKMRLFVSSSQHYMFNTRYGDAMRVFNAVSFAINERNKGDCDV